MDNFVARENIKHLRYELENGAEPTRRATMIKLLVQEENIFGHTGEQLQKLDRHISRLAQILAQQVELTDGLNGRGRPTEQAEMVLATLNDVMTCYIGYREQLAANLKRGSL